MAPVTYEGVQVDWEIGELRDDDQILAVLRRDQRWTAYAICDLSPPYRRFARFVGATVSGEIAAVVLVYDTPDFKTVLPCGDPRGVRAVMERVEALPHAVLPTARLVDLAALETRYRVEDIWIMWRMVLRPEEFRPPAPPEEAELRPLDASFAEELVRFYQRSPGAIFSPTMLEHGRYVGAFVGAQLVAVAGTHVVSWRYRIACVGGVFTDPAFRRRRLAQATTGAVVESLLGSGVELIALNVRVDNEPAVAAYRRLGFRDHCRYWEGKATLNGRA